MKHSLKLILAASAVCMSGFALAADKSNWGAGADDATFKAMLKSGFREKGIAKLTRLDQDATQAFCSDPVLVASKEGPAIAAKLEAENLKTVKWPSDGKWLGDPAAGEASLLVAAARRTGPGGRLLGQELDRSTWQIARAVLAIRDIDADLGSPGLSSITDDQHVGVRADAVLIDPPVGHGAPPIDLWKIGRAHV